jgi:hypothetical protein
MKFQYQVIIDMTLDARMVTGIGRFWLEDYIQRRLQHPVVICPRVKVFYEGRTIEEDDNDD